MAHKATLRRAAEVAMANKGLANLMLDSLSEMQAQFNSLMDKLDADNTASLDTDYEATLEVTSNLVDGQDASTDAPYKAKWVGVLRSVLKHKGMADETLDALEEAQVAFNALLVKLDAEGGTMNDTDYESTLAVADVEADESQADGPHKASYRRVWEMAMANSRVSDAFVDGLSGMQAALNDALAQLDVDGGGATGALTGLYVPFKVTPLDPESTT